MKFVLRQKSSSNYSRVTPIPEPYERKIPRPIGRPLGRGRDYRCDAASAPDFRTVTRLAPPAVPEEREPEEIAQQMQEMPQLASAETHAVPPPVPEEIKPEMPPLASAMTHPVPPPAPEEIKPDMLPLAQATTRLVPPPEPEEIEREMQRRGLLGSLFFWIRGGAPARKQLRLVETVPLGEKRFVAIIHAQGRKYLVGGGATGVALLTSLDEPATQHESIAPLAAPVEVAG